MKQVNTTLAALGLLLALAPSTFAAEAAEPPVTPAGADALLAGRPVVNGPLTADQAVEIALRESPMVRGAVAEVEAAAGRVAAARAERRPMVSTTGFLSTGDNAAILGGSPVTQPQALMSVPGERFADLNVMLMAPLYTGGRLEAMVRQARAMRSASEFQLAGQRQDVALMTRTMYNEVLARRAMVEVARTRLRENEERLRLDRARLAQEAIPAYYVQRTEAETAAARQELTNAQRDVDVALVQLRTVMGVDPSSRIEVAGALESPALAALLTNLTGSTAPGTENGATGDVDPLPALLSLAQRDRPEIRAAEQQVRGAAAETSAIRGAYRPQVGVTAMGDLMKMGSESSRTGNTIGLTASLPLYTGGMREARIRTAEAERRRMEQEREQVSLQVAQDVSTALLNARAAQQNVTTAQAELTAARAEYEAANLRYQVGRSIVVEVLDALAALTRAESNVVEALFQYNVARDQLLRSVGRLDRTITQVHDR